MSATPEEVQDQQVTKGNRFKNMALFLASPFIGLVYAVLLPGKLFQLAMSEHKARLDTSRNSK
jgi:hypothetical protein